MIEAAILIAVGLVIGPCVGIYLYKLELRHEAERVRLEREALARAVAERRAVRLFPGERTPRARA